MFQEISDPEVTWKDSGFSVLGQRRCTPNKISALRLPIIAEYFMSLLDKLRGNLMQKCRGKLSCNILFLKDNAPAHIAHENTENANLSPNYL